MINQQQIEDWLAEGSYTTQPIDSQGVYWALLAVDKGGRSVAVIAPVAEGAIVYNFIILQSALEISPDTALRLAQMQPRDRAELVWELRQQLLHTELDYEGVENPLTRIIVSETIYGDCTEDTFLRRVNAVKKGIILCISILGQVFDRSTRITMLDQLQ